MAAELLLPEPDVLGRVRALAGRLPAAVDIDIDELLTGRAARMGLRSRGRTSAGGSARLLPAPDGWVAVNLARRTDVEAVPAIVEDAAAVAEPWAALARFVAGRPAAVTAARCQLLGVPGAVLDDPTVDGDRAILVSTLGPPAVPVDRPLVVDLSSMWAGPLCARLLGRSGMDVVKVESAHRPDGARFGDPGFFAWLHEGHEQRTLDLASPDGRRALLDLVARATVVVESSRPRALAQLGVDAAALVRDRGGLTWVGITGYGRTGGGAGRVAFGDDAAVAAGLVGRDAAGDPVFIGDAIADPLTGLAAAVAALEAVADGGGRLLDVSMAGVARGLVTGSGPGRTGPGAGGLAPSSTGRPTRAPGP